MFCTKCGKEASGDACFCKYCGALLLRNENQRSPNIDSGNQKLNVKSKQSMQQAAQTSSDCKRDSLGRAKNILKKPGLWIVLMLAILVATATLWHLNQPNAGSADTNAGNDLAIETDKTKEALDTELESTSKVISNTMAAVGRIDYNEDKISEESGVWGNISISRRQIGTVTFLDSLKQAPSDAWDVSEAVNGSVLAWVEKNGELYDLYVAGEGGVVANKDCFGMFQYFTELKTIHYNQNFNTSDVTETARMFYCCTSLNDTSILGEVTCIGERAFCGCSSLTRVIIPSNVNRIEDQAFYGCKNLVSVTISDDLTSIGDGVFVDTPWLDDQTDEFVIINSILMAYNGDGGAVTIPDNVTSISGYTFYKCTNLTNVSIPDSVTSIGRDAFAWSGLICVTIPDSVICIGENAFYCCGSLTNVEIGDSVTSVGDNAFYDCGKLTYLSLGSSVRWIGKWAFSGCGLANAVIPNSIISIGERAFCDCERLTSVIIPDSLESIGEGVFCNTPWLEGQTDEFFVINGVLMAYNGNGGAITIPNSVISIDADVFRDCTDLTDISIPDSVTSIGSYAFYMCTSLTSVDIVDSVTSIGDYAFSWSGLINVTIPDSLTNISNYMFFRCYSLASVNISDSVTSIGERAFGDCISLTSVSIPDSVTNIGDCAFGWYQDDDLHNTLLGGFTIYGHTGTAAENYARENGIHFSEHKDEHVVASVNQGDTSSGLTYPISDGDCMIICNNVLSDRLTDGLYTVFHYEEENGDIIFGLDSYESEEEYVMGILISITINTNTGEGTWGVPTGTFTPFQAKDYYY